MKLTKAEKIQSKVWRLHLEGFTVREIGKLFGKSYTWAHNIIKEKRQHLTKKQRVISWVQKKVMQLSNN